jgi:hypothetical protein
MGDDYKYQNRSMQNSAMQSGMGFFTNALKVTLGAGMALGGAYLFSRVGEKQNAEASLSRLEQMISELGGIGEQGLETGKKNK